METTKLHRSMHIKHKPLVVGDRVTMDPDDKEATLEIMEVLPNAKCRVRSLSSGCETVFPRHRLVKP
jgi:hypothetical protein